MYLMQILFLILVKSILTHSELFTSTTHLIQLLNTEIALVKQLEIYLKKENKQLDNIQKFIDIIKDEISQAKGNEEYYFGNPINSYLFFKHLTIDWNNIKNILPTDLLKIIHDKWLFPSIEDYIESALGLMRLQDTYELSANQMANGKISSKYKSKKLSALECFDLGLITHINNDYYHTLMWMQQALDHFNKETMNTSIEKFDILYHLAYATFQQGNIEHALALEEELLAINLNNVQTKNNKRYYEDFIKTLALIKQERKNHMDMNNSTHRNDKGYKVNNKRKIDYLPGHELYEELCRRNSSQLRTESQDKLFCRYRHNNHPYLILQPIKEEQVLNQPAIFLFHDIIRDKDIKRIKSLATPRLTRSGVRASKTAETKPANFRVSKSAWLRNGDSLSVARLSRLIEAVTNLTTETADDLQVVNYGVGGHYITHVDFVLKTEIADPATLKNGNRIATWLTYMSDVEQGGATVFPVHGVHLKPKKGSAIFWYNLYRTNEGGHTTMHAGCPVLIGNK